MTLIQRAGGKCCSAAILILLINAVAELPAQQFSYVGTNGTITITGGCQAGAMEVPNQINGLPVTGIGNGAFNGLFGCSLLTSVVLPEGLLSIGHDAFANCVSLTNITLPKSLNSIGFEAFVGCSQLTDVAVPEGITQIQLSTFRDCTSLTNAQLPSSLADIENLAFQGCSRLFSVTISNSHLLSIGAYSFYSCPNLTSLTLGTNLTSIGGAAFAFCSSLTNVTISDHVSVIEVLAFLDCSGLTTVTLGTSLTSIGAGAFENCSGLTSVAVPDRVTVIESGTFQGCSGLTNLTLGSNVTSIGPSAFASCVALTNLSLPKTLSSLDASAFDGCYGLTAITLDPLNPWFSTVEGVLFDKQRTTLLVYPAGKTGNYTVPIGVTSIGQGAFSDCTNLAGITIPEGVTNIGQSAFSGCGGLKRVTLPNSLVSLGYYAFSGCTGMTNVDLPNSLTNLPGSAFMDCINLSSLVLPTSLESIGSGAFWGCRNLTDLVLPNSLTLVGDSAFAYCNNLTNLLIGQGVDIIGYEAFYGCSSLTQVAIPASVTNLVQPFEGCIRLTSLTVDALNPSYSALDGVLFDKTRSTIIEYPNGKPGDYNLPSSVTTIGPQAFSGSVQLTRVTIPSSLLNFWSGAFTGCTNLKGLYFEGNAPTVLGYDTNLTTGAVYYLPGTTLWGRSFANFPTALWQLPYPILLTSSAGFGIRSNQFSFTVSWATNAGAVVEASTNLDHPFWQPVQSNSLLGGTFYFSDPQWTNYRSRFYRVRPR